MNREELATGLREFRSAAMVAIDAETVPEMRKTGNPYYGRLTKRSHVNGVINWIYETAVNRQRTREGRTPDFEAVGRAWGQRLHGTPLVEYKGRLYLEVKVQSRREEYVLDDGSSVAAELVAPWLSDKGAGRQDLDKPVVLRDFRLDHITAMTWGGQTFPVI